ASARPAAGIRRLHRHRTAALERGDPQGEHPARAVADRIPCRPKRGKEAMPESNAEPKPVLPFLQPFYDAVIPWTWPLIRVAVGWDLIVHGWGKILRGPVGQGALLASDGGPFGVKMAVFLTFIEFVGGICIALGLFTRFFAAAVAIEMGYLTFI